LLVTHPTAPKKFIQICRQIFAFPANRQTDRQKHNVFGGCNEGCNAMTQTELNLRSPCATWLTP